MKTIFGILGTIGVAVTFMVWCCAKIGATQDRINEGLRIQDEDEV